MGGPPRRSDFAASALSGPPPVLQQATFDGSTLQLKFDVAVTAQDPFPNDVLSVFTTNGNASRWTVVSDGSVNVVLSPTNTGAGDPSNVLDFTGQVGVFTTALGGSLAAVEDFPVVVP